MKIQLVLSGMDLSAVATASKTQSSQLKIGKT